MLPVPTKANRQPRIAMRGCRFASERERPGVSIDHHRLIEASTRRGRAGGLAVISDLMIFLALGWSVLGYWFLDCGEIAYSMLSSMTALTAAVSQLNIRGRQ